MSFYVSIVNSSRKSADELAENTKSELKLFSGQAVNALKSEIATMVTDKLITASVKDFAQDKTHISTRLCQIIVNYLIYLGLFTDKDNDPLKMRSTIEYILSKKEMPRFPSHSLTAEELNSPTSPLRRPTHLFDDLVFQ